MNQNNGKGMSIAALVCGILGVVLCWGADCQLGSFGIIHLGHCIWCKWHEEVQSYRSVSGTGNCRFGLRYCWRCILSYRRYLHYLHDVCCMQLRQQYL